MQINEITVPDEGVTTEYLVDKIGGRVYVVHTGIRVEMILLSDLQKHLDDAKARVVEAQGEVATLEAHVAEVNAEVKKA